MQRRTIDHTATTPAFHRAQISRRLWLGAVAAILLSVALAATVLTHLYHSLTRAEFNAQILQDLHLIIETGNRISAERAPVNLLLASDADGLNTRRQLLQQARQKTDNALARLRDGIITDAQLDRVVNVLASSRRQVDISADQLPHSDADAQHTYDNVQQAVKAMMAAYDSFNALLLNRSSQMIGEDPELSGAIIRALVLCSLRDDAGRLGSHIIAPLVAGVPMPAQNREDSERTLARMESHWEMLWFDADALPTQGDVAMLGNQALTQLSGDGRRLVRRLIREGLNGGTYSMNATEFTLHYIKVLTPLEDWSNAYLNQLVSEFQQHKQRALGQFFVVVLVATLIVSLIAGIVLLVHLRILKPLLEASEVVIALADEKTETSLRRHCNVRELQPLFEAIDTLGFRLQERVALTRQLKHQADTDGLTQLLNRRAFISSVLSRLNRATSHCRGFLILLDIDHFKAINDNHGHPTGDAVLIAVAEALANHVRPDDLVGRIGGEEFAVLLLAPDINAALNLASRLQQALRELLLPAGNGKTLRVTASFGIAEGSGVSWQELLSNADSALYAAKHAGRDCVHCYNPHAA
ncbi:GGDEF domain-containing protein [Pokkaliibacter sp. MBI-7]|uniref:GGDEF domain-containing protein n=1 Tax=Pokkaliibacter sp. MBI-7 TaxID=3040600 RepID=UPI00244969DB|nr:GGDEF domain-containing protein [Pokkaliibacter sp. MBI-7]MDH2435549.1 GGDEF domain-containing protein [Pokkaliibacter sp. MBI-7]